MITLIFILGVFTLVMVGLYELSMIIWPDQKKCDWEIRETLPEKPLLSTMYYDTTTGKTYIWDGEKWV